MDDKLEKQIEINTFSDSQIDVADVIQKIIEDGKMDIAMITYSMLSCEPLRSKGILATDKISGGVAGLLLLDECETFVEVSILYVLQKYRGSNISLLMIDKAKQYAKEKGKVIKLFCDKSMITLYEKMGFKKCESLAVMIYDDFLI